MTLEVHVFPLGKLRVLYGKRRFKGHVTEDPIFMIRPSWMVITYRFPFQFMVERP